jgi:hypothetical protein
LRVLLVFGHCTSNSNQLSSTTLAVCDQPKYPNGFCSQWWFSSRMMGSSASESSSFFMRDALKQYEPGNGSSCFGSFGWWMFCFASEFQKSKHVRDETYRRGLPTSATTNRTWPEWRKAAISTSVRLPTLQVPRCHLRAIERSSVGSDYFFGDLHRISSPQYRVTGG